MLTGRKYQRLHGRLKGLFDNRYLGRLKFPWKKDIYHIAKPGLAVLLREGLIGDEQAERRVREGEIKSEDFLEHELMISDIHVMLTLATRSSLWELVAWKEGKEIHDSFKAIVNGQYQDISIQPDAFFTLRDATAPAGERKTHSFSHSSRVNPSAPDGLTRMGLFLVRDGGD